MLMLLHLDGCGGGSAGGGGGWVHSANRPLYREEATPCKKSGLMSVSLTKLFFDKGISRDKCCRYPIWKLEASSINLSRNLIGVTGSSCHWGSAVWYYGMRLRLTFHCSTVPQLEERRRSYPASAARKKKSDNISVLNKWELLLSGDYFGFVDIKKKTDGLHQRPNDLWLCTNHTIKQCGENVRHCLGSPSWKCVISIFFWGACHKSHSSVVNNNLSA